MFLQWCRHIKENYLDTTLRLSKYYGNSAKFGRGLQDDFDIEEEQQLKSSELNLIEHFQSIAADQ
jgi:plasmid maintenance system antidote protein VapI